MGQIQELQHGLIRVLAPNPSPMTYTGTNSYVLGDRGVCVIDPGPDDPAHLEALLRAIADRPVSYILVTHSHVDHSALAPALSRATGAPVVAYGRSDCGRSRIMQRLAADNILRGGEGVDTGFAPDITIADGAELTGEDWSLTALHTPGHMGNHICLVSGDVVFSGDHVMGWASSVVSPPDGDLTDFLTSCHRLRAVGARLLYPGHGAPVPDPEARITWLITHRQEREAQILTQLATGPASARDLALRIYNDIPPTLLPVATRNVLAHLIDLTGKSLVAPIGALVADARFERL